MGNLYEKENNSCLKYVCLSYLINDVVLVNKFFVGNSLLKSNIFCRKFVFLCWFNIKLGI